MDGHLVHLAEQVGLGEQLTDPDTDTFELWRQLREARGPRVSIADLYRLESWRRGLALDALPDDVRSGLRQRAVGWLYPGQVDSTQALRRPEPVELVAADPRWAEAFASWRRRIVSVLGEAAVRVEHVGSTSVPGLAAKPVVDVQVSVEDVRDEAAYVPGLESLGLALRAREDDHRFLRPRADLPRDVHVHVCAVGSAWERDHLLFRDYLRATPSAREHYLDTKRAAARAWRDDRIAYMEEKTSVILDLLDEANRWAEREGHVP